MSNNKEIKPATSPAPMPADNNNDCRQRGGGCYHHNRQRFHDAAAAHSGKFKRKIKDIKFDTSDNTGLNDTANLVTPSRILPTIYNFSLETMYLRPSVT
jgi:hypothetical protein